MLEKSAHQEGLWPTYSIDDVLFDLPPQVLETVCTKKGFDPATHRLQHHRKFLDTSTTVRFSGERYPIFKSEFSDLGYFSGHLPVSQGGS